VTKAPEEAPVKVDSEEASVTKSPEGVTVTRSYEEASATEASDEASSTEKAPVKPRDSILLQSLASDVEAAGRVLDLETGVESLQSDFGSSDDYDGDYLDYELYDAELDPRPRAGALDPGSAGPLVHYIDFPSENPVPSVAALLVYLGPGT
jgi:hypothetical protein